MTEHLTTTESTVAELNAWLDGDLLALFDGYERDGLAGPSGLPLSTAEPEELARAA